MIRIRGVCLGVVAFAVSAGAGCGPIETKIPSTSNISVPAPAIIGNPLLPEDAFPADLVGQALAQSMQQSFDTSGYDKAHVAGLKLTKLSLKVTNAEERPAGHQLRDLAFLQKLTVFLGASGSPIKVAESGDGDFTDNLLQYDMPLTDAELADAFKNSDSLEMTSDVVAGDPPQFNTDVQIDSEITAQISLF